MALRGPSSSALLLGPQHDLVDKVDDGHSWLLRVHLSEQVTHVLGCAARPPGHKTKHPLVLRLHAAEGHTVDGVVSPEKESSLAVGQRDTLSGHFEVDHCGCGPRTLGQSAPGRLGDSLRPGQ